VKTNTNDPVGTVGPKYIKEQAVSQRTDPKRLKGVQAASCESSNLVRSHVAVWPLWHRILYVLGLFSDKLLRDNHVAATVEHQSAAAVVLSISFFRLSGRRLAYGLHVAVPRQPPRPSGKRARCDSRRKRAERQRLRFVGEDHERRRRQHADQVVFVVSPDVTDYGAVHCGPQRVGNIRSQFRRPGERQQVASHRRRRGRWRYRKRLPTDGVRATHYCCSSMLFVCCLAAHPHYVRQLVPWIVEVEHIRHVKNNL